MVQLFFINIHMINFRSAIIGIADLKYKKFISCKYGDGTMNIKKTILFFLMLGTTIQAHSEATLQDSERCIGVTVDMTHEGDGCIGETYCKRTALICVPRVWWVNSELHIPSEAPRAPLVLAFHGKDKQNPTEITSKIPSPSALYDAVIAAPEAGMFAYHTNLHGAMPNAIVVYFQGLPTLPNWDPAEGGVVNNAVLTENPYWRGWQVNPGTTDNGSSQRDLKYVYKLINQFLVSNIDLNHIYAVGHSNGSRFAGVLWHDTSTNTLFTQNPFLPKPLLKGIAFVSAQAGDFPTSSNPAGVEGKNLFENADNRTSLFMTMGKNDTVIVPFSLQQASISKAEELLGIDLPVTVDQPEDVQGSNGSVKLRVYKHALADGHGWPDQSGNDAHAAAIAQFFASLP